MPPATSTSPFGNSAADCPRRDVAMLPVTVHLPVLGLYSSALLRKPVVPSPPANSTWPFGSRVALWPARSAFRLPVTVQVPELAARAGTAEPAINPTARRPASVSLRIALHV